MSATSERQTRQIEADREELADRIARSVGRAGSLEVRPELCLYRVTAPTEPMYGMSHSAFCVIAQGSKQVLLGEDRFRYDPNHYLISTMGLPTVSQIDVASPERPYLGLRLV